MTARKDGKTWTADFYENGRSGRRIRKKGFVTKSAAIRYEQDFFAVMGETGRPLDDRLSDLVKVWYDLHGCTLKDGGVLSISNAVLSISPASAVSAGFAGPSEATIRTI